MTDALKNMAPHTIPMAMQYEAEAHEGRFSVTLVVHKRDDGTWGGSVGSVDHSPPSRRNLTDPARDPQEAANRAAETIMHLSRALAMLAEKLGRKVEPPAEQPEPPGTPEF